MVEEVVKGLIIKSISGEFSVSSGDEIYVCKPRGILKYKDQNVKVGDYVDIDPLSKRPVIANVDKSFLVFSVKEPDLNLNLLDRLIAVMEYNDIKPIIVFSKIDLLCDDTKCMEEYQIIKKYYQKIGYKVYEASVNFDEKDIIREFDDCVCVLAGQSGVGKSSILNRIDDTLLLRTNEISHALGRGKHTTRHIELHKIGNGYLADSPGFGIVDFFDMDELALSHTFVEMFEESQNCKFSKCLHINEPKCRVKELVEKGEILKSRYENYLLFNKEIEKNKKNKY